MKQEEEEKMCGGVEEEMQPALPMGVPVSLPKPSAWSGGEHDGSRLTQAQRAEIYERHLNGQSTFRIARETKHSRNTIAALINPADATVAEHLQATRKARMLQEEDDLMRLRGEVMAAKADAGKLSVGDMNSAVMIAGIGIKESGGAAPQRIRVEADPSLIVAAQIFSGQFRAVSDAARPVIEAEVVAQEGNTEDSTHCKP